VPVVLFDLPAKEGPKNGIVSKAVEGLKKLKPGAAGRARGRRADRAGQLRGAPGPAGECDLVIEAIAERMDWKLDLYRKIAPALAPHAIVASNTSGLSITKLSEALPEEIKPRFCGIHFFNPPRYMALVELIATPGHAARVLDQLEAFVTTALGKGVVRAKDTPNFIANRVGIAGMLATIKEAETFGLSYDVVDDLTGKKLGRASSGTFRTADVVGLDTMAHVIKTLQDNLGDDPFFASYATPPVLGADRAGRAGPEDRRGLLQEGRQGHPAPGPGQGRLRARRRQGRPIVDRMLKKPAGRAAEAAARIEQPAGAVPVGHPARRFHYAACTWATSPTARATSTSRCAGASA
jgi:3-hydroxyacyl-CoA dehydrogenase